MNAVVVVDPASRRTAVLRDEARAVVLVDPADRRMVVLRGERPCPQVLVKGFAGPRGPAGVGTPGPKGDSFRLSGAVDTYADLPAGLTQDDAEKAWLVYADSRVYVWSGTAWPADGAGALLLGDQSIRKVIAFAFGDASPRSLFSVPVDSTDVLARLVIDTPFNGAGAELALGTAADPGALIAADRNDPTQAVGFESAPDVSLAAGTEILLTITPGAGASQGTGRVIFDAIPA